MKKKSKKFIKREVKQGNSQVADLVRRQLEEEIQKMRLEEEIQKMRGDVSVLARSLSDLQDRFERVENRQVPPEMRGD